MNVLYPDLFEFRDFRSFLLAYAKSQKSRYPHWSYGAWARRLGVGGTATITRVVRGDREPGPMLVEKLVEYFAFSSKEAEYFRALVHQAKVRHLTASRDLDNCGDGTIDRHAPDLDPATNPKPNLTLAHRASNAVKRRLLLKHEDLVSSEDFLEQIGETLREAVRDQGASELYEIELNVRRVEAPVYTSRPRLACSPLQKTGSAVFQ